MLETTDKTFRKDVLESNIPVLLDFYASWCGPCQALSPILERIQNKMEGKLKIVKMNIENNVEIPNFFKVRSIPTLVLIQNEEVKGAKLGLLSEKDLIQWIENSI